MSTIFEDANKDQIALTTIDGKPVQTGHIANEIGVVSSPTGTTGVTTIGADGVAVSAVFYTTGNPGPTVITSQHHIQIYFII